MKLSAQDILKETQRTLDLVAKAEPSEEDKTWLTEATASYYSNHVNPGILEYRKSVSTEYVSVEWADGGNSFTDLKGRKYLDLLGGYGIFNVGHRHPKVIEAVTNQLKRQALHSQELLEPFRAILAKLIHDITPGDLQFSFFGNSGAEAVEGAMKLAMLHTGRKSFVAATEAFHGKTLGALSATAKSKFRQPFLPILPDCYHVPYGDADYIESALRSADDVGNDIAAVILEPVQGEGGINVPPDDYLPRVRDLCDRYGALLIVDEVQTGMGRTGKMFCVDHWNVVPDIMTLGKAMGGGVMPIGAFVSNKTIWEQLFPEPWLHSTTFGGNPLACVAAIANIHVLLEEKLPERAEKMGGEMINKLRGLRRRFPKLCVDVRGKGLMIGLEFPNDALGYEVAKGLFDRGVLVAGTLFSAKTLRIEPPLTISAQEINMAVETIEKVFKEVNARHFESKRPAARKAA
ncbi:MAG: putrescine aminotransferase [Elusimicrobia bacterium]|nr:putrescine aminotransferase [Elusimicrobiota bacterium]MDE2425457.1 putrescine aminotransferase [Elusimicrobiota bacterium]